MHFESMYSVRRCLPPVVFGISITICASYPRPAYPLVDGLLILIHVMKRFNPLLLVLCVCAEFLHVHLYFILLPLI